MTILFSKYLNFDIIYYFIILHFPNYAFKHTSIWASTNF